MTGKHRDRGTRSPDAMRWISKDGHLCRFQGGFVLRGEYGLRPIRVEHGDVWSREDEKEQDA